MWQVMTVIYIYHDLNATSRRNFDILLQYMIIKKTNFTFPVT